MHFRSLAIVGLRAPGNPSGAPPRFVRALEPTLRQRRWPCSRVAERVASLIARRPSREPDDVGQTQVFKALYALPRKPQPKRIHVRGADFDFHDSAPMEAHERITIERFGLCDLCRLIANSR